MFGSFLTGFAGFMLKLAGVLCLGLSAIGFLAGGPSAGLFLLLGLALIAGGSFLKYQARHTVRVRD